MSHFQSLTQSTNQSLINLILLTGIDGSIEHEPFPIGGFGHGHLAVWNGQNTIVPLVRCWQKERRRYLINMKHNIFAILPTQDYQIRWWCREITIHDYQKRLLLRIRKQRLAEILHAFCKQMNEQKYKGKAYIQHNRQADREDYTRANIPDKRKTNKQDNRRANRQDNGKASRLDNWEAKRQHNRQITVRINRQKKTDKKTD